MNRRGCIGLGLAFVLALVGRGALAQETDLPDPAPVEGIPAGPIYLQPYVGVGVSYETNPFYQVVSESDTVARLNPGLGIMFPFLKSYLRGSYDATFRRYDQTDVTNTDSDALLGELSLLFGSFDRLVLLGQRMSGASEVLSFDGGETTYDGTPFRYGVYTVGAERDVPGHLGYEAVATWSRLSFSESNVNFFEFEGYDLGGDAAVPLSSSLWIVGGARMRRYDHFRTDDPTHAVFRKEEAETLRAGIRGVRPGGRAYHAILAYDWARYPGGVGSDFDGLVGDAAFELALGPSTALTLGLDRRRWSSFYGDNNYYMSNTGRVALRHVWRGGSDVGVTLAGGVSAYPDPESIALGGTRRRDDLANVEAYVTFALRRHLGLRLRYNAEYRESNVPGVAYDAQSIGLGLLYGWPP